MRWPHDHPPLYIDNRTATHQGAKTMTDRNTAADRLGREFGVHVEWAPILLDGQYVVEGRMAGHTAREAARVAREVVAERSDDQED